MKKVFIWIWHIPRNLAIILITFWQKTFSLDHGPLRREHGFCRFTPSCSEYGKIAYEKYGFIKGSLKTAWRILRCNPLSKGGKDLP
jgi:putative membrane protein insertion efficiency factor